jgi:antitoxin PrlF
MTRTFYATVTSKGQVTIPVEVRRALGIKIHDKVAFVSENGSVRLKGVDLSLENVFNSVKTPEEVETGDFEALIEIAAREESDRLTREFLSGQ